MNRLALASVALLTLITGCSPQRDEGERKSLRYQHVADEMTWKIPDDAVRVGRQSFLEHEGVLYSADYRYTSSGGSILAVNKWSRAQLWNKELRALGPITHEKYSNEIWMKPLGDDAVVVYGDEAYGNYVEILDRKTGVTLGHKVFKEEWK